MGFYLGLNPILDVQYTGISLFGHSIPKSEIGGDLSGEYSAALEHYRKAVELCPMENETRRCELLRFLGGMHVCIAEKGLIEDCGDSLMWAEECFDKIIAREGGLDIDAEAIVAYYGLSKIALLKGDIEGAHKLFDAAAARFGETSKMNNLFLLSEICLAEGDAGHSRYLLETIIEEKESQHGEGTVDLAPIYRDAGKLYSALKDNKSALACFNKSLKAYRDAQLDDESGNIIRLLKDIEDVSNGK